MCCLTMSDSRQIAVNHNQPRAMIFSDTPPTPSRLLRRMELAPQRSCLHNTLHVDGTHADGHQLGTAETSIRQ